MTKKDEKELDKAIALIEDDQLAEEHEEELFYIAERLCQMDSKDYRHFLGYMRHERRARKHLGSMSFSA